MRILHLLDHSIPLHSGYTFRTLAILREQRTLGWDTFLLTSAKQRSGDALEETTDSWHFYRTPEQKSLFSGVAGLGEVQFMRGLSARLEQVARAVRPHVLHVHSPVLNALPALRVGHRLGIPIVYEVRAFWEDAAVDHGTSRAGGVRYHLSRAMESFALRRVDAVTTICEGLRRDIVARGIPAHRVTVIPNAVDIVDFAVGGTADEALKARLGLTGATVLGFIGSFYAYEGLDLLIAALPAIVLQRPEVRLLLVGGGPQEATLKAQARSLGLADKVLFAGRVPHSEVQRYYDLVDVLVYARHSMRLTELVTPLKPLEAMAQGRLFVASDVGGHKELIEHGRTGILFRAGSTKALAAAVLGLLADGGSWTRLRAAGRRFVEAERGWAASVGRYKAVYGALVKDESA